MKFVSARVWFFLMCGLLANACSHHSQNSGVEKKSLSFLSHEQELASIESRLQNEKRNTDLSRLRSAKLFVARSKLTKSLGDLVRAKNILDDLLLPKRSLDSTLNQRPYVVRAQLFYHIHQFQKSKEDLLAARAQGGPPDGEHAILLLEFDNALNRDDFVEAEEILHDLLSTKQGFEEYSRKAQWEFRKGQTEKSLKTLAESRSHVTVGEERIYAWHYYMQGLMHLENEEWMEALKNFEKANQDYPGYWLFEEHLAETLSQLGRLEEAEEIYKGVILKTQASEFYFAMAATLNKKYSAKNDPAVLQSVQSFVNLGIEKLEEELKILPEAVSAHAMEALLDFAHPRFPAERVLAMAKQNLKMRPNGESKILYSKVLRHQGKTEESKKIFCEILRTSYRAPQVLLLLKKWQLSSQDCAKK